MYVWRTYLTATLAGQLSKMKSARFFSRWLSLLLLLLLRCCCVCSLVRAAARSWRRRQVNDIVSEHTHTHKRNETENFQQQLQQASLLVSRRLQFAQMKKTTKTSSSKSARSLVVGVRVCMCVCARIYGNNNLIINNIFKFCLRLLSLSSLTSYLCMLCVCVCVFVWLYFARTRALFLCSLCALFA